MINKFILVGQLSAEPVFKYVSQGLAVCELSLKTKESYNGNTKEIIHKCSVFGQQAEEIYNSYRMNDVVALEGKVSAKEWTNPKTGETQSSVQLIVQKVQKIELDIAPEQEIFAKKKDIDNEGISKLFPSEAQDMDNMPF